MALGAREAIEEAIPEPAEPHVTVLVDEHIGRLDVLIDEIVSIDLWSSYKADGDAQEASQVERSPLLPLENPIERFASRVLEHEDCLARVANKHQGLGCPCWGELGCERLFMLELPQAFRRWLFCCDGHSQNRRVAARCWPR